jgi:tetratricopeptide (TPR) repeat protein
VAERYLDDKAYDRALEVATRYYKQSPDSYILGMLFAKSLLRVGRLADAEAMLVRIQVLPYEGATDGRALHREVQLLLGAQAFRAGRTLEALRRVAVARQWPENLGAGKPYPEDVDERLENWLEAACLQKAGRMAEAGALRERVAKAGPRPGSTAPWPTAGATADEARILAAWQ